MALELKDRIYTTCTNVGTSDIIIGPAKEGYQGWEAITLGSTVYYCITDDTAWEVGYGQYLDRAGTKQITRNVLTSNTGEKLVLTGNASVFCTYPSEKAVILNTDDNIYLPLSNVNFKNVTSNKVVSPTIVTEAVIVDGTSGTEGDLAKLLNVYTKDEIQEIRDNQNEENAKEYIGKSGGEVNGKLTLEKPRADVAQNSFVIKGRISGETDTLFKDYQRAESDNTKSDFIEYYGGSTSEDCIMNKRQITKLINELLDERFK